MKSVSFQGGKFLPKFLKKILIFPKSFQFALIALFVAGAAANYGYSQPAVRVEPGNTHLTR